MITSSLCYKEYNCTPYQAPFEYFLENMQSFLNDEDFNILHFAVWTKPWQDPYIPMANSWWKYARKSPFYGQLIWDLGNRQIQGVKFAVTDKERNVFRLLNLLNNKHKIKQNYYRCKMLSFLTIGAKRKHYKNKKELLKHKIREIRMYEKV